MNKRVLLNVLIALLLTACASSGPKTQYYTLFADEASAAAQAETALTGDNLSFGIGPVILPEYLENPAVVSRTSAQQISVSGVHAWGGSLKTTLSRVLARNLANYWQQDSVWAFPWDNRVRPQYQVRIVFEDFAGERGGEVRLAARWMLYEQASRSDLAVGTVNLSVQAQSDSVTDYVAALNLLLNDFSLSLAGDIRSKLASR